MKKFLLLIFMCMFFISLNFVSGKPPFQQSDISIGLVIETGYPTSHKIYEDYYIHAHVYNATTGFPVISGISCYYHFYNHQINGGEHISIGNLTQYGVGYNATISGNLINETGEYSALIWCNSTLEGGFFKYTFEVTPSGRSPPTQGESLIYGGSLLSMILFSVFFFMLSLQFKPSKDAGQNEDGSYNPIPNDKPALRFGCLALSLIIGFVVLFYVMVSMQNLLYGFDFLIDSYYIFMWLMGFVFVIIFIFVLISLLIQAVDSLRSGRGLKNV